MNNDNTIDLKSIIDKRNEVYEEFTKTILHELENVRAAAITFLDTTISRQIVWHDVICDNEMITLIGTFAVEVGERVVLNNGKEVEITDEMLPLFNQVIKISVPLTIAVSSQQEIIDYLTLTESLSSPNPDRGSIHESENTSHHTVADLAGDFRSTGLTDEQIQKMIIYAEQSKGKVN